MASVIEIHKASETDRQTVREFFYVMPFVERGKPLIGEMLWVLQGRQNEEQHAKTLPDYCHNIFEALRVTYFKNYPALTDIIFIKDPVHLSEAKTVEAAKKVIQMDWKNLGQICGIGMRCLRFAELEAENGVDGEGFNDYQPQEVSQIFTIIFGKEWAEENSAKIASEKPDKILAELLNQFIAEQVAKIKEWQPKLASAAYQWSPTAMTEFNDGVTRGLTDFLDENGQLVGESNRSVIYFLLLLAWPEIKLLLESNPKKTVTDLHEWMQPFMRMGIMAHIDIDKLRDICGPPPRGIGLSLRPLKNSS